MHETLSATYRQGVFIPHDPCSIPDETDVKLMVIDSDPPQYPITDPVEREIILRRLTDRMRNNPIPIDAPRFTREELYERG